MTGFATRTARLRSAGGQEEARQGFGATGVGWAGALVLVLGALAGPVPAVGPALRTQHPAVTKPIVAISVITMLFRVECSRIAARTDSPSTIVHQTLMKTMPMIHSVGPLARSQPSPTKISHPRATKRNGPKVLGWADARPSDIPRSMVRKLSISTSC